jgi:hypothetical protein
MLDIPLEGGFDMEATIERFTISVTKAEYAGGYKLRVGFSDGKTQLIDFGPFLRSAKNPAIRDFLDLERFKTFRIEYGDLPWGDYDLCFPIMDLYQGKIT